MFLCILIDKTDKVDYDPFHRNPQYCHAETECIWELENLAEHFHPSVALFAKQLLMVRLVYCVCQNHKLASFVCQRNCCTKFFEDFSLGKIPQGRMKPYFYSGGEVVKDLTI